MKESDKKGSEREREMVMKWGRGDERNKTCKKGRKAAERKKERKAAIERIEIWMKKVTNKKLIEKKK